MVKLLTNLKHRHPRRGFALLLVLLLSISAGMILALMMDDLARVRRRAQGDVLAYRLHHAQAGLRDMLEVAIRLRGINLLEVRGEQTAKLTLRTAAGEEATFELSDGQGQLLWDQTESGGPVMLRAASLLFQELGERAAPLLRSRGPARISLNAADRAVLRAVMLALDPESRADQFADRALELRAAKPIIDGQYIGLIGEAGLKPELAAYAGKLFTLDVNLFRVAIEVRSPGGVVRYRALLQADQRATQPASFLSFEAVPADEPDPRARPGARG